MHTYSFTTSIDLADGTEVDVVISYDATYTAAIISRCIDDCSPADGEIVSMACFCEDDTLRSSPEFHAAVSAHGDRLEDLAWAHYLASKP